MPAFSRAQELDGFSGSKRIYADEAGSEFGTCSGGQTLEVQG
jgi:hypothetical protein